MKFLEKIFSIKNEIKNKRKYKVITFLGFKIKFRQKSYDLEQQIKSLSKKLEKQNEKISDQKKLIKELRQELKTVEDKIDILSVKENPQFVLKKIQNKIKAGEKINVLFLIREKEKWSYESLYREFEKSEFFTTTIAITTKFKGDIGKQKYQETYDFFKNNNYNIESSCLDGEVFDLKTFNPDIVFYDQPWGLFDIHKPKYVSEFALTMYCPYGIQSFDYVNNYKQNFHKFLYKYFVEHDLNIKRFESYKCGNSCNCVAVGYPKMDEYLFDKEIDKAKYWKNPDKFKIIYAPHYTCYENSVTNIGTFFKNKDFILNFAKTHPETTWIYKPHPRLEYALTEDKNLMSKEEYSKYKNEWESIGNIYENGDYIDIFKSSDLMITDCASFLSEYLPSKHPLIRLRRPDSIAMNELGEKIISEYYNVWNNEELEETINMLISGNDPKKENREKLAQEIFDYKNPSATKIYNYILDLFRSKDD